MQTLSHLPSDFPEGESHFFIPGPAGRLETLSLSVPAAKQPASVTTPRVGVICHPHPLKEGTMHNKVVHTLSRAFMHQGIHSLRFNYRGVGHSEGSFGDSIGEVADLMAVIAWLDSVFPQADLYLAGFSFGAYIAAMGATQRTCQHLFSIAPAVTIQPYDQLPPIRCPWTIVQGENDEVVSPEAVYTWYERAHPNALAPMNLIKMPDTGHFFHSKLILLREYIENNV